MSVTQVLIIDDSQTARLVLRAILESSPDIVVCGEASDAYEARNAIKTLQPDVITLDIEMPKMDGITFLRNLMRLHPIPTIMVSTLTEQGSKMSIEALAIGAIDCIHKPNINDFDTIADEIISKVHNAATTNVLNTPSIHQENTSIQNYSTDYKHNRVIAIGASTGGVPAIEHVVSRLPTIFPPVVMVQHIPGFFATSFANRMNDKYEVNFHIAEDDQPIEPNNIYLAPGDQHLEIIKNSHHYHCKLHQADPVCYQRPSVDVLFNSVAKFADGNASAALLTGMGKDGAKGLLNMKRNGCFTIIQDKATSLVWGMPGAAAELNGADKVVPLDRITQVLLDSCYLLGDAHVN